MWQLLASSQTKNQVKGGLLLDVVVAQSAAVLQLFSSEDKTLLVWWDSLFILDLSLHVLDGVRGFNLQGDGLASQGLHEDLHSSSQSENKMECALFLDIVVAQCPTILELLSGKDQTLLIWGNSFLVLDLCLHVLDRIRRLDFQSDGFPGQGFNEDLHTSPQSQNEMKRGLLLDVIITECSSILQLFAGEDKTLLIWGNSFLILDLSFDVLDRVGRLHLQSDGLSSKGLDEDLHTSPQSKDQVKSRLFLNVVVAEGSAVFQLLSGKDQSLLVWWDSLFVLDFGFHILDGVGRLNLECDGLACQSLHEDLHTTSQPEYQMKS